MRVVFEPPTENEFAELFLLKGGSLQDINVYNPSYHPRGGGLFSVLGGLMRKAAPFLLKTIAPAAVEFGKGVLDDVGSGREPLKRAIKRRGVDALRNVGRKLVGGGKKRRLTCSKMTTRRRAKRRRRRREAGVYKGDVFSML